MPNIATVKCHFHFQMVYSFVQISPEKHFFESILVTPKGFQPSWQLPLVPQLIHYTYTQLDKYQKMQMPPSLGKGSHIFIQQTLFEHLLCPGLLLPPGAPLVWVPGNRMVTEHKVQQRAPGCAAQMHALNYHSDGSRRVEG